MQLPTKGSHARWLEAILAMAILCSIAWNGYRLSELGYLPQPFFYEPSDTFADWFNPAHWARLSGVYDTWRALYPPISFVLLRILGIDRCYDPNGIDFSAGLAARSCDWVGISAIIGFFVLNIFLVYFSLRKVDASRALMRTTAVALGYPALNGLERGNLVLVTFTCLILGFGPLIRSFHLRSFWVACAINFKVYLVAAIVPLVLSRQWRRVEQYLLGVVLVYLVTYALLGSGSVVEIADNIRNFAEQKPVNPLDITLAGSYNLAIELLKNDDFPSTLLLGTPLRDGLLVFLPLVMRFGQLCIVAALLLAGLKSTTVPPYRLICLGILLAEITSEAGAYSIVYHSFFVMMEPWRGFGRKFAIVLCYLAAIPIEIPIDQYFSVSRYSFLSDHMVSLEYALGGVALLRPLSTILVGCALAMVTMKDVLKCLDLGQTFRKIPAVQDETRSKGRS